MSGVLVNQSCGPDAWSGEATKPKMQDNAVFEKCFTSYKPRYKALF